MIDGASPPPRPRARVHETFVAPVSMWQPRCAVCGPVGAPSRFEDARLAAQRHEQRHAEGSGE